MKKKTTIKLSSILIIFTIFLCGGFFAFLTIKDNVGIVENNTSISPVKLNIIENQVDGNEIKKTDHSLLNSSTANKPNIKPDIIFGPNDPYWPIHQYDKYNMQQRLHFIHIPKCGGTTMTVILRMMMCDFDPIKNIDCCTNPGFCDHSAKRKCGVIRGCINHFANR